MKKRNRYINNIDLREAIDKYSKELQLNRKTESVNVDLSVGRVTSNPVYSKKSSPHYNSSAMDGIAVNSKKTENATEINPIILEENKDFKYVNTGNPIQKDFDSVIMIEDVIELEDGKVQINKSSYPWKYIRNIGEDIIKTEMILPSNHKIRGIDLGAILSGGIEKIEVYKRPKVGILPTGSEIVSSLTTEEVGKITDSNSYVLGELTKECGGEYNRYLPVKDDYELLKSKIQEYMSENDILIVNAGSSAGTKDYTASIIEELGKVIVHGIGIKPGKPTILGIINEKPAIGVPGYPVSAYISFDAFVKPIILNLSGEKDNSHELRGILSKRVFSSLKHEEFIRVNLGWVDNKIIVTPISGGAGSTMSLIKADGIAIVPKNLEGIEAGEKIRVKLLKDYSKIKETLVSIGSDDIVMDIIGDMMNLSSAHVGSLGGILSMKKREAHIAPIHLLDEKTGEYNLSYVRKYFDSSKMAIIKGIKREQGFIVEKGNPKNIKSFKDLTREDIVFLNRQRGSGTRILLDYYLEKEGIENEFIAGYNKEYSTHMDIAQGVKSKNGNVGIGIKSASDILELDFIKIGNEEYDFLIYKEELESKKIRDFIGVLKSIEFREKIEKIPGYRLEDTGEIIDNI